MYCSLADIHTFLNIPTATTADDALINTLIAAACQRINDYTKRRFEAPADETLYYDPSCDTVGRLLDLNTDVCHITSVTSGVGAIASTEYTVYPRNSLPWREIVLKSNSAASWSVSGDNVEDSIVITCRRAAMHRRSFTAIARATNVVTITMSDTSGFSVGQKVYIVGVADTSFNVGATLTGVTDTTVTFAQTGDNDTDTTGAIIYTPASIRQAATRLTAWLYRQKDTVDGNTDRPLLAGDGSVIMPATLPNDVQALLHEWVLIL